MHETILHRNIRNRRKRRLCFVFSYDFSAPRLADDLGSIQGINVVGSVDDFIGADAIGVVEELDHRVGFFHLIQLSSVPSKCIPIEGSGGADGVVGCSPL